MSDEFTMTEHDDERHLAAEYVLGVLDRATRARAARRLAADAAFRAEVEAWERRLGPMMAEVAPAEPPPAVWNRIAGALDGEANVVPFPARARLWDRVGAWRAATAASLAAAAVLAVIAFQPAPAPVPAAPTVSPILIATLASTGGKSLYVATIDRSRAGVTVVPVGGIDSRGRTPELWLIPVGGKPRPVGLLAGGSAMSAPMSPAILSAVRAKAVLAVSLEPPGGSPTGAPTGPVIASGVVQSL